MYSPISPEKEPFARKRDDRGRVYDKRSYSQRENEYKTHKRRKSSSYSDDVYDKRYDEDNHYSRRRYKRGYNEKHYKRHHHHHKDKKRKKSKHKSSHRSDNDSNEKRSHSFISEILRNENSHEIIKKDENALKTVIETLSKEVKKGIHHNCSSSDPNDTETSYTPKIPPPPAQDSEPKLSSEPSTSKSSDNQLKSEESNENAEIPKIKTENNDCNNNKDEKKRKSVDKATMTDHLEFKVIPLDHAIPKIDIKTEVNNCYTDKLKVMEAFELKEEKINTEILTNLVEKPLRIDIKEEAQEFRETVNINQNANSVHTPIKDKFKKKGILDLPMPPITNPPPKLHKTQDPRSQHESNNMKRNIESKNLMLPDRQQDRSKNSVKNIKIENIVMPDFSIPPPPFVQHIKIEPYHKNEQPKNLNMLKNDSCQTNSKQSAFKFNTYSSKQKEHFREMEKHLKTNTVLTPIESKAIPPAYSKRPRPSPIVTKNSFKSNQDDFMFRKYTAFEVIEQVGEGTYGKVFKAKDKRTGNMVAMKYIRMENENEGFPITCLREIKILYKMNHENIIKLHDIVFEECQKLTYLVFEYMNHDLLGLIHNEDVKLNDSNVVHIVKQILEGINYCHQRNVIHRDLKLSNILVNNDGIVKLADFGLARTYIAERPFTNKVISLWYRPIELLLGEEMYTPAVDIWSVGCMVYELFTCNPLFPYNNELDITHAIYKICGTPNVNMWPNIVRLPRYKTLKAIKPCRRILREYFQKIIPPLAVDLIDRILVLNPERRITAEQALRSNWILEMDRKKVNPFSLPKTDSFEMRMKNRRSKIPRFGA